MAHSMRAWADTPRGHHRRYALIFDQERGILSMRSNIVGAIAAGLVSVAGVLPGHAQSSDRVTLVTKWTEEPVVAVDPRDPRTIVAGSNINGKVSLTKPYSVAAYTSHDRGRTFTAHAVPLGGSWD